MMNIFGFFGGLFGYLLWGAYYLVRNYGVAIIIFTIVTRLLMFPMNIKQQKSMAGNARLASKQRDLQAKYANDRQKYNEELQKLYAKEGVSPTSGCLTSFIPLILMLGVFYAVAYPLTNTLHLNSEAVNSAVAYMNTIPGAAVSANTAYAQIELLKVFPTISDAEYIKTLFTSEQISQIIDLGNNFNFLGLDLLTTPQNLGFSIYLIIPALCFITSIGSQIFMMRMKGSPMEQQQGCMKFMFLAMPLISVYFSFIVPAAVGFYWIFSTIIGFIQSVITNKFYNPTAITAKAEAQHVALLELEEAQVKYDYNPSSAGKTKKK